jgi:hypothetical protein
MGPKQGSCDRTLRPVSVTGDTHFGIHGPDYNEGATD